MKSLNRGQIRKNDIKLSGKNRNKPCPCGSNVKYKNCHGKIQPIKIDELLKKEGEKKEAEKLIAGTTELAEKLVNIKNEE
jgi:hypothetical protein